jgi:hypothetical protein
VLQANRGQYRRITGYRFNGASASSGNVDKDFSEFAGFKEAHAGSVSITGMFKVYDLVCPSLWKPPSLLGHATQDAIAHFSLSLSSLRCR